jgi:hypothetical protein
MFVRLFLNGDYWGIYALQEGFGTELMDANDRKAGVIIEFDAEPLWEAMAYYGGDLESAAADPITNLGADDFRFLEIDTFRDREIADDPELASQKDRAIGLLRGLQNGDNKIPEVFDVEKYGRFLALVDLWAATEAVSLTNLRFYYDPNSGLLEPIGFNSNPFGSQDRISMGATFGDPTLQTAYLQASQRMVQAEYLEGFAAAHGEALHSLERTLAPELEQGVPWELLAERQELISLSLNPLQPVFAYLGSPTLAQEGIIQIDVANVLNLPVEIIGFDIDGATFLEANSDWIEIGDYQILENDEDKIILPAQDDSRGSTLPYIRFHLPLTEIQELDEELSFLHDMDVQVATRILGLEDTQMTLARPGYPDIQPATTQPATEE